MSGYFTDDGICRMCQQFDETAEQDVQVLLGKSIYNNRIGSPQDYISIPGTSRHECAKEQTVQAYNKTNQNKSEQIVTILWKQQIITD
jgi:hypothetical protein